MPLPTPLRRAAALVLLPLALAACGGDAPETASDAPEPSAEAAPAAARMEGGVQVVEIEAGPMGYSPGAIALRPGVPARLVFTRTVESECSEQVQIPAFDVPVTDLPLNEPVAIEFTPDGAGTFEFVCGMDMQRGSILIRS